MTVSNILKVYGADEAPDQRRRTTWQMILEAH